MARKNVLDRSGGGGWGKRGKEGVLIHETTTHYVHTAMQYTAILIDVKCKQCHVTDAKFCCLFPLIFAQNIGCGTR